MTDRIFVGFGFGAIQAGLFLYEAHASGNFKRLVVAEVMADVVDAVRRGGGSTRVNVATRDGIEKHEIPSVEILNPAVAEDREALIDAIGDADEIATALPSVRFYGEGGPGDVVCTLRAGLKRKTRPDARPAVIYTAENHNHAAEILSGALAGDPDLQAGAARFQCLNTVIGKMSGVVTDPAEIAERNLAPMADGLNRAFLVEQFNRILITRIRLDGFARGITVFEEKDKLLPFEEAKLYGHNAMHALLGYLLRSKGCEWMTDARDDVELMELVREASLRESGAALGRKHAGIDPLFTEQGYTGYTDDLLERMLNPWLRDTVERITRDPRRKLGWDDRLVGTMRLALGQGITPTRYALGGAAALRVLAAEEGRPGRDILAETWPGAAEEEEKARIRRLIAEADLDAFAGSCGDGEAGLPRQKA